MKFSIITPIYNRDWSIGRAIESVLSQDHQDWELLLCDDGSSDQTRVKTAEYLGDPRISLVANESNRGAYVSRNLLLDRVKGDVICFLDSDDLFLPDALSLYKAFLESNPLVDVAISVFEDEINGVLQNWYPKKIRRHICPGKPQDPFTEGQIEEMIKVTPDWEGCLTLCQAAFRSKCFSSYRFKGVRPVAEDRDLFQSCQSAGFKFGPLDKVTYSYRIHPGSLHVSSPRHAFDATPLGIIIPYRNRESLLKILLEKLQKPSWTKVYIVEEDEKESLPGSIRDQLDGYVFRPSNQAFNRSGCFNLGFKTWNHPYYLLHDLDLVPQDGFWTILHEKMTGGPITLLFPWDEILYLSEAETQDFVQGRSVTGKKTDKPVGGSVLVEREFYQKVGGMNQEMIGWGLEDYEFLERCKWIQPNLVLRRVQHRLVHLWHGEDSLKPPPSKLESLDYKRNCEIYNRIKNLPTNQRDDLRTQMRKALVLDGDSIESKCFIFLTKDLEAPKDLIDGSRIVYLDSDSRYWEHLRTISPPIEIKTPIQPESPKEILEDWALDVEGEVEKVSLDGPIRKKVLIVADRENWAFDRIAHRMKEALNHLDCQIEYSAKGYSFIGNLAEESFDLTIMLGFCSLRGIARERPNLLGKTIFCGYDHLHYASPDRSPDEVFVTDEIPWVSQCLQLAVSSKILQKIYSKHFPGKTIHLIQDAVDIQKFHPTSQVLDKMIVGWCGATNGSTLKGVDIIRRACEETQTEFICLDRDSGGAKFSNMLDFYHRISVYICASLCEGTPNPILEAAACGLPWISTNVGIVNELWQESHGGIIVNRNMEEFKKAILCLKDSVKLRMEFGERNRKAIENSWKWEDKMKTLITLVNSSLGIGS